MEQTILPILIMINRQGRKSKTAANLNLSIYRKNKHQLRISFFSKIRKKRGREKKQPKGYAITSMANSSRTGAVGCALASLRYLHYNKEQQQQ